MRALTPILSPQQSGDPMTVDLVVDDSITTTIQDLDLPTNVQQLDPPADMGSQIDQMSQDTLE